MREVLEFTALNAATKLFEKLVLDESKERAWVVIDEDPNLDLELLRVDGALTRSEQVAVDQARDGLQAVAKKYVVETFELGEDDVRSVTVADEATGLEYVIEGQAEAVKLSVLITFVDEDVRDDAVSRNDAIKPIYSNLLVINFDGVIVERAAPRPTHPCQWNAEDRSLDDVDETSCEDNEDDDDLPEPDAAARKDLTVLKLKTLIRKRNAGRSKNTDPPRMVFSHLKKDGLLELLGDDDEHLARIAAAAASPAETPPAPAADECATA